MAAIRSTMDARRRIIDHGEVFTPPGLVADMLDLVAHECTRIDARFLEPACGDGNFLAAVLGRKLATVDRKNPRARGRWERGAVIAVSSLYGIDLLADNVAACRERLLAVTDAAHRARFGAPLPEGAARAVAFILEKNIVHGDALSLRTAGGAPIVFSEWSPINGTMLKRRDFAYGELLDNAHTAALPLFSDLGEDVYLPKPAGEFPPCHYLRVADMENGS